MFFVIFLVAGKNPTREILVQDVMISSTSPGLTDRQNTELMGIRMTTGWSVARVIIFVALESRYCLLRRVEHLNIRSTISYARGVVHL